MLDTVQKHRIKSMRDYGIKHSTLIEACTSKGNHLTLRKLLTMLMALAIQMIMEMVSGIEIRKVMMTLIKIHALLAMNMESS